MYDESGAGVWIRVWNWLPFKCPFPIAGREKNFKLVVGSGRANVPIARKMLYVGKGIALEVHTISTIHSMYDVYVDTTYKMDM